MKEFGASTPGRVCFAGEKLDWLSNGPALTCSTDSLRLTARLCENTTESVRLFTSDVRNDSTVIESFSLSNLGSEAINYCEAVAIALEHNGTPITKGADLFIDSRIPQGKGLSSSAALCVSILGAIARSQNLPLNSEKIASLAYDAERFIMGINCGQLDQYAVAIGGVNKINSSTIPAKYVKFDNVLLDCAILISECGESINTHQVNIDIEKRHLKKEGSIMTYIRECERSVTRMEDILTEGKFLPNRLGEEMVNTHTLLKDYLQISNGVADALVDIALRNGVFGAKTNGKGNVVISLCLMSDAEKVRLAIEELGHRTVISGISGSGLKTFST